MKNLEFKIVNNEYLEVLYFTWLINKIDAIYLTHSEMGKKSEYGIFIQQGSEVVELYYRSIDEVKVAAEFKRLCNAITRVTQGFKKAGFSALINYNNVTDIQFKKGLFSNLIITKFNNDELIREDATRNLYNEMIKTLKSVQTENNIVK